MFLRGEYTSDNATYGVLMEHTKTKIEILLVLSGTVVSAYKMDITGSYSYNNNKAKELASAIQAGLKGCTKKRFKGTIPGAMDVLHQYEFTKAKTEYIVQLRISDHVKELGGISFQSDNKRASIVYANNVVFPENIPYVKLTEVKTFTDDDSSELDDIQTRSVQEIALEKEDVSWLLKKKYYIIKDDEQAEQLFSQLEQYGGLIAYDTETTGLKMNCYSKIGSKYMADLDKYNTEHPDDQMRADRLVGIIFCVEPDVSYYFPCFNRKFKNLYQDKESPWRKKLINNIRARYTIGDRYNPHSDMYKYITTTPDDELRLDVLLMERVRNILEKKDIATHHGAFEWKVGWCYEIDTNIKEDSMLMHQLMYKFRSTTRNSGEPSNLKYLARVELGIDQWELKDFFPNFKEDKKGTVRRRPGEKKNTNIDFSYMDEEGARVYAPCDGDVTLQLCFKYKTDMLKNHKEIEYLYQVEILVSMAIGYMEFYGHRIDESKILDARLQTQADIAMLTEELRQAISYDNQMEDEAYAAIKAFRDTPKSERNLSDEEYAEQLTQLIDNLNKAISGNTVHVINLSSPAQVGELFYDKLGYPMTGDKKSVDKKTLKALIKEKDENGNLKYPVVKMYRDLKDKETLLSKFFDNLNYFMYIGAGGLIFSSYGQIATATGRMSCIEENQYVTTVGGSKKIKDIKPGELVYCYDDNGNIKISKVNKVIDKGIQNCIKLNWVSKGSNKPGSLICTPDHKIKLREKGWVQACNIEIGDRAYHVTRSDSDRPRIYGANGVYEQEQNLTLREVQPLNRKYNHIFTSIEAVGERHVYDLEIDGYHNFIASEICVHNCNKPNAQQYPKVITKIVVPRPGYVMVDADYSQIEYRVLTALAKNDWLAKLFSDPDSDYHTLMASLMYDVPYSSVTPSMRSAAKSFNFGIPYGMGLGSLAILLTGKNTPQTRDEAAEKMEDYFRNQPKTRQFFTDIKESAKVNGYTKTAFGRRRYYTFTDKDGNVDNGRMAAALRQAGNAVIQGTAADVFKISVARNFSWIRANKLLGLVLIINMVHDEQLMEIDAQHLNVQRALAEIGNNMQFDIDGFPPLYIGAGVGKAWGYAKGKMAEIHPVLLQQYTEEARAIDPNTGKELMPLWLEKENWDDPVDTNKVLDYFEKRVIEFRRKKVADYITDPSHFGDVLHPAIAGLINLQFNYGRGDDAKAYTGPNGEKYDDAEFLKLNLTDFIKENHLDVDPDVFKKTEHAKEEEPDDDSYDDNDEGEDGEFELDEADDIYSFSKIDESDKIYGSSIRDLVSVFKACVLEHQKVVALDTRDLYFRKLDAIADFLNDYVVDETEPGNEDACQIVFLTDGNVMKYTGIYVKGITQELLERVYKLIISGKNLKESDFTAGDVKTRSQAK